jgi:T1SS-143 domain-containing protein
MATQIGVITAVVGTVTATAEDGSIRTLQAGDRVYANEVISTGPAGAVEIEFADGSVMDLGRDSQAMLDSAVFNPNATELAESEGEAVPDDVAAIQQAILEGEDPTEAGEATAAGAGVEGSDGGHDAVFVNYLNPEVTPEAGFDTIGVNNTFDEIIDEQLIDGVPTAGITEVLLDEDDLVTDGEIDLSDVSAEFLAYLNAQHGVDAFGFDSPAGVDDERTELGDDTGSPDGHFLGGSLVANFGLNGPSETDPIIFNVTSGSDVTDSSGNPVTSHGHQVKYWVSADGLTVIGYIVDGDSEGGQELPPELTAQQEVFDGCQGSGDDFPEMAEIIFTAQMTPNADGGSFLVGIFGQFDHAAPDYENGEFVFENNLFLNLGFTITDADGDSATGTLQINVDDDSPVRAGDEEQGMATQSGTVYEDSLSFEDGDLSEGNPNNASVMLITSDESDADQSDIESFLGLSAGALEPAVDSNGGAGEAGNGSAAKTTLTVEAGDIISFNWVFDNGESGSDALEYNDFAFVVINGEVIELADSSAGNLAANPFTYEVTADGEITIGFGQMNVGDTGVDSSLSVSDLTLNGNPVNGGFDGSLTGWDTLGTVDSTDSLISSDVISGNLNNLVNMGADVPGSFALLQASENEVQQALFQAGIDSLPTLSSKGEAVSYSVQVIGEGDDAISVLTASAGEGEEAREVFTLTIFGNGQWEFDLNDQLDHVAGETAEENFSLITLDENGEPNGSVDSIDFTQLLQIRDFDGDQLIITEDDAGMFTISIKDDIPVVGDSSALVDDDALEGGNDGGIADDNGDASFTGSLNAQVGSDEPAVFSFAPMDGQTASVGTETVTFSYDNESAVLTATITSGDRDGTELFTVTLDTASGEYTVDLLDNVLHESLDGETGDYTENNAFADLTYSITDNDGDTVEGTLNVNFDDDMPTVEVAPDLAVNFFSESFEDFSDISGNNFTVVGQGGGTISGSAGIVWTVNGAGLEIQSGNAGDASASDGDVHAELDTDNNDTLLTQLSTDVDLPSADVILSFDYQPRPNHEDDSDMSVSFGDYSFTVNSDAAGNVTVDGLPEGVTAELTEAAGGWTTITLQFSGMDTTTPQTLTFEGLGNANEFGAYLDNINMSALPVLAVDESGLENGNPETGAVTTAMASFDFSGYFTSSVGADEEGTTAFSLSLSGEDIATGLYTVDSTDTSTENDGYGQGAEIVLNVNGEGVIEGTADGIDGPLFTISVDANGVVTLEQLQNIWNDDTADTDEAMSMLLEAGTLLLTKSVTDADGDTVSADLDISGVAYRFEDDAPIANEQAEAVTASVEEDGMSVVTEDNSEGNKQAGDTNADDETSAEAGTLTALFIAGADAPVTISLSENTDSLPSLYSNGNAVSYSVNGNVLTASAGGMTVFTLTVNADGSYDFDLQDKLDHVDDGTDSENSALVTTEGSVEGIDFSGILVATDTDGDSVTGAGEGQFVVQIQDDIPVISEDGSATVIHDESALAQPHIFDNDAAHDLFTFLQPLGEGGPVELIGVAVNSINGALQYSGGADGLANVSLTNAAGESFDGQASGLSATQGGQPIYLYSLSAELLATIGTAFGVDLGDQGLVGDNFVLGMTNATFDPADPAGSYDSAEDFLADIAFVVGLLEGEPGSSDDQLALLQLKAIQHEDTESRDDDVSLENLIHITVTDNDGDSVVTQNAITVTFDDDGPTAIIPTFIVADEDNLPTGVGDDQTGDLAQANLTGTLSHTFGADGAGSIGLQKMHGETADFTSNGEAVTYSWNADTSTLTASTEVTDSPVFTMTVNAQTGEYEFTLLANVDHSNDGFFYGNDENPNFILSSTDVNFKLTYTVTDGDGDSVDGDVYVTIDDDMPVISQEQATATVDDEGLVDGIEGGPQDDVTQGVDESTFEGSLNFSTGADQPGSVDFAAMNGESATVGTETVSFSWNSVTNTLTATGPRGPLFTVEVTDTESGDYTVTLLDNILHESLDGVAGDNTENNASVDLEFTVTDNDGDSQTGNLTVDFDDDTPVVTSQQINLLTESFENFAPDLTGNNWTVVGEGGGTIIGNNGIEWTVNGAGIEIQSGNVGGASASDGDVHAELDAHDSNGDGGPTLTVLSTDVDLPTPDATLSFDFQPRPDDVDGSDMAVSLGGQMVNINVDGAGVIDFGSLPAGVSASQSSSAGGWTTITLTFTGLDTSSAQTLSFEGVGSENTLGAYIDNISLDAVASLTVDESALADGNGETGASTTASFDFSGFFSGEFGADGPAGETSESYSLSLNGQDVASGLYTVDNSDTAGDDGDGYGQGTEIVLNQVGDQIIGSAGGTDYFTINVNAETGEVTLTQLENVWHADTTNPDDSQGMVLDADLLSLVKTLTDADGDSAEATLDLGGVSFNFEDDAPAIEAQQPAQPYLLTVTNEGGDAGYNNTYGFYIKGENGEPVSGEIIWANVKDNTSEEITVEVTDPSDIGFFIIPDGADLNDLSNGDAVTFQQDGEGNWEVLVGGEPLSGQGTNVLFDNADLNPGNTDTLQDNAAAGNQNWEDIIGGDNDFNDVNINVSINQLGAITVDETDIGNGDPSNATATLDLSGSFTLDFGADGEGDVDYSLSVADDAESGLVDTVSGKAVELRVNGDGGVEGYITTDDNLELAVFTASVDDNGEVTLTQLRAVEHDDVTDPDEANSPATLNAGAIALTGTVTDADGDSASDSIDVGVLFAFEDDGPSVGAQSDAAVDEGETVTGQLVFDAGQDEGGISHINGVALEFGQDGYSQEIELDHGTLQVKANGEYSYSVDSGSVSQDEVENFNFTVTDGDGDTAQGAVAITIVDAQVSDVVTLNDVTVNEGDGTATLTGSVENPVTGSPLIITLDNGATITIPVGDTSAASTPFAVQGDDPYVDGESYTVEVTGTSGGNYSSLDTSDDATVTVNDTIDTTTVTLDDVSVAEDGTIIYNASVDNAPQGNLTITLTNGVVITIPDGATTGSSAPQAAQGDDVYVDGESFNVGIQSTSGGNYEDLDTTDTATVTISDTIDTTTVTLDDVTVAEDGTITYSASVDNAPQGSDLTITLNNGVVITIPDGATSGSSAPQPAQGDDVYVDADSFNVSIDTATGGNYEQLDTSDTATVTINDTIDTVTATLSTSTTEVNEDGGDITYTITLSGGPGDIDPDTDLIFNLANGEQVTISAGDTSGSFTRTYSDGEITNQASISNSIAGIASGGSEYEDLQTAGTTTVDVDYTPDISNLTPEANGGDVTVDEDDLADGSDTSKESTTQEGTFTISSGDAIDDLTIDGHAVITDGTFSTTSFTTALGNILSVTGYDANTGEITYTYELSDNTLSHGPANNGENGVFENLTVSLSDVDGDEATDTLSVQIIDDVPTATADSAQSQEGSSETLGSDLVLMIDTSASVDSSDLNSLKTSLQNMFNSGSVNSVFITSFAEGGTFHDSGVNGGWFTNLGDAMDAINGLSSSGSGAFGTDYDAALEAVTENFTAPPPGGGQLVSMFISDGEPNENNGTGSNGITSAEEAAWIQFLENNGFDNSYAVGYNGLNSGDIGQLEPIAWTTSETNSTYDGAGDENVIILDDIDDLTDTLESTVTATPEPVTGNVLDNDTPGADGYGAPALVDVTYDGTTVTFSDTTTSATFETDAGTVVINSDGSYEFTGLADTDTDISATIDYTIQDGDGDQSSSNLVVTTQVADELYVGSNQANTYETQGGDDVLIGDLGGRDQQYSPGSNYSIALIADESGSMAGDRNELLKDALESFVNDLADHDGVINIALIGFGPGASLEISVSDLANNPDGLDDLLAEIDDLGASGGTNYEAAFDEAVEWFDGQPDGHEFISYFMTDGDPTLYNGGGDGNETDFETFQAAVEAFEALSAISEVNGIGIGNGVNEDYLRFFDNTNNAGTGTETFGTTTTVLANFSGSNDQLDEESDWDFESGSDESSGQLSINNGEFRIRDNNGGPATTVNSNAFTAAVGSILSFDFGLGGRTSEADNFSWKIQKDVSGTWTDVQTGTLEGSGTITSDALDGGNYRLQFSVDDQAVEEYTVWIIPPFWSETRESTNDDLFIDNISLEQPINVTGPVGEPQVINDADELTAQLQTGNTTEGPADLGDDVLQGGEGDDVIFGDTLFTDNLTWTNDDTGETFSAGHGLGYEGLVEYLTWAVNDGTAPDDAQIMQYIRDNYDDLINPAPTQAEIDAAGDDTLIGGGGDDILIGGEGADIFQWNEGDDGSAGSPAVDTVVDFNAGEGDVLNLADLLDSDGSKTIDDTNLDNYLKATFDAGSNQTKIDVYTNGDANTGGDSTQSIFVNGNQQDLTTLLNNNNLDVDQS